jgi:hypothetical protein
MSDMPTIYRNSRAMFDSYAAWTPAEARANGLNQISQLQVDLAAWQNTRFEGNTRERMALGMAEEAGEMYDALVGMVEEVIEKLLAALKIGRAVGKAAHAILKAGQKIRQMGDPEKARAAVADAIADLWVFTFQLCTMMRLDAGVLLFETAAYVMARGVPTAAAPTMGGR